MGRGKNLTPLNERTFLTIPQTMKYTMLSREKVWELILAGRYKTEQDKSHTKVLRASIDADIQRMIGSPIAA